MRNLLIIVAFIIASCDIQPKTVKAEETTSSMAPTAKYTNNYPESIYDYQEKEIEGMIYGIWYVKNRSYHTGYSVFVVNITKDMLEVQLLRQQISNNLNK